MILIDSTYINSGGGKVLLNYYLTELSKKLNTRNIIIVDSRLELNFEKFKKSFIIYTIVASEINRLKLFKTLINKYSVTSIINFNNIPPPIKIVNFPVYIFFHNVLYIDSITTKLSFYSKFLYILKFRYIKFLNRKNYIWLVQTDIVKDKLMKRMDNSILTMPIFDLIKNKKTSTFRRNRFLFVADGNSHKNHDLLFEAFYILGKEFALFPELVITIDPITFPELNDKVIKWINLGLNLNNVGLVPSDKVIELYQMSKFVINPSLNESFGLPLLEAVHYGCKLISIDLPYVFAVVKPSEIFSGGNAYELAMLIKELFLGNKEVIDSEIVVQNQMERLINL